VVFRSPREKQRIHPIQISERRGRGPCLFWRCKCFGSICSVLFAVAATVSVAEPRRVSCGGSLSLKSIAHCSLVRVRESCALESRPSLFASRRVLRGDSVSKPSISSSLGFRFKTGGRLIVFDPLRPSPPLVPGVCQSAPELPTPCPCYRSVSTTLTQIGLWMPQEFSTMKLQYYSRFGTALVHLHVAGELYVSPGGRDRPCK
jgi:hypothetical protein